MRILWIFLMVPALWSASIHTIAGTGQAGYSGDGGPATEAQIKGPFGVLKGPDGGLYICDTYNHVIRRMDPNGNITTVAGTGQKGYSGDGGPATQARLNEPYEVRFDAAGNMVFVEMQNHLVRQVDAQTGRIRTIAGTGKRGFGGDGGPATKATMNRPHSIQYGPAGHLYICDIGNHRIRRVDAKTGHITTFAGTGSGGSANGQGTSASFYWPIGLNFDLAGNIFVADQSNNRIRRIDTQGNVITLAGTGSQGHADGSAASATFKSPRGVFSDRSGNVYVSDSDNHLIRKIEINPTVDDSEFAFPEEAPEEN